MKVQASHATRVAAATMIAMAVAATTAHAQNLLINGDFEQFDPNDNRQIPGWTQAAGPFGQATPADLGEHYNNTFSTGEQAHNDGGRSFKSYAPYNLGAGSVGIQRVAATAGTTYTFSGFINSPVGDNITSEDFGLASLGFRNSAGGDTLAPIEFKYTKAFTPGQWIPFTITATAPANTAFARVVIGYIQTTAAPTGAIFYDDLSVAPQAVVSESNWIATGSGGWLTASNWQGGVVPNAVGATANFGSSITAPSTVTIAGAGVTSGTVRFNNAASAYTVGGTGTLTLDVASGSAALTVQAGSHSITAPLVVNDNTTATVAASQTLTLGGALTLANGSKISSAGTGTLRLNGASVTGSAGAGVIANGGLVQADVDLTNNVDASATAGELRFSVSQHVRSLAVSSGAKATLSDVASSRVIRTPTLTVAPGGTLELGDNYAIVEYTGTSPAAAIRTAIIAGRTGNNSATGIISSKALADSKYAVGYGEASALPLRTTFAGETGYDSTTLLVRVTLTGDATLDGTVNFDDLVPLAQNYNKQTGSAWTEGDFTYDGIVNFDDLVPLAQNYNASAANLNAAGLGAAFAADWALAQSLVPEPTTMAALISATALLVRRRDRKTV